MSTPSKVQVVAGALDIGNWAIKTVLDVPGYAPRRSYHLNVTKRVTASNGIHGLKQDIREILLKPHVRYFSKTAARLRAPEYSRILTSLDTEHINTIILASLLSTLPPTCRDVDLHLILSVAPNESYLGKDFVKLYANQNIKGQLAGRPEVNLMFRSVDWELQPILAVYGLALTYTQDHTVIANPDYEDQHFVVVDGGSKAVTVCEVLPGFVAGARDSQRSGSWQYLDQLLAAVQTVRPGEYSDFTVMETLQTDQLSLGGVSHDMTGLFKPIIEEYQETARALIDRTVQDWAPVQGILVTGGMSRFLTPFIRQRYGKGTVGEDNLIEAPDPQFYSAESGCKVALSEVLAQLPTTPYAISEGIENEGDGIKF